MNDSRKGRWLIALASVLFLLVAPWIVHAQELTLETGGVQILLGSGWEEVHQSVTFFIQAWARNSSRKLILSCGSFMPGMSLEQFTALEVGAKTTGSDSQLDYLARQVGLPREEVDKALASIPGKRLKEQIRQASSTNKFELISIAPVTIPPLNGFEVHSRMTRLDTRQIFYTRHFVLPSAAPHEIVAITFLSPSKEVFTFKELVDSIHPRAKPK